MNLQRNIMNMSSPCTHISRSLLHDGPDEDVEGESGAEHVIHGLGVNQTLENLN